MSMDFDAGSARPVDGAGGEGFDPSTATPLKPAGVGRKAADLGLSLAKGVVGVPEAAIGIADIVTGGQAGKQLARLGVRPKEAKDVLEGWQSDDFKGKQQEFEKADGILAKTGVALTNPSLIANTVVESLPSMGAGGVVGRGLGVLGKVGARVAPEVAGAVGEGVVGAGQAAEQIRQETPEGELTPTQAGLAALSGAGTTAFGILGGKMAKRMGIADADTAMVTGTTKVEQQAAKEGAKEAAKKGVIRRTAEGAASEGLLEELPQSVWEQGVQNVALGKPITEGLEGAAVMGTLAGGAMGAGAGALTRHAAPPPAAEAPAAQPPAGVPLLPAPDAPPAGPLQVDQEGNAGTAAQIDLMRRQKPISEKAGPGDPRFATTPDEKLQQLADELTGDVAPDGTRNSAADRQLGQAAHAELQRRAQAREQDVTPQEPAPPLPDAVDPSHGPLSAAAAVAQATGAAPSISGATGAGLLGQQGQNPLADRAPLTHAASHVTPAAAASQQAAEQAPEQPTVSRGAPPAPASAPAVPPAAPIVSEAPALVPAAAPAAPAQPIATEVDAGAHQAAASPLNQRREPTKAQILGGNAKLGHARVSGMDVSVENPAGAVREDKHNDPPQWRTQIQDHYGYLTGTIAADSTRKKRQGLDVFVKAGTPPTFNGPVFVVDQVDPKTGKFDEHKVILGAADRADAEAIYRRNYEPGWNGLGAITEVPLSTFKAWAYDGKRKAQPVGDTTGWRPNEADGAAATPSASPSPAPVPAGDAGAPRGGARAAPAAAVAPLRLGITPNDAEPVTVRGGVVHIGESPALNYDTGEPVTVPEGANPIQIRKALTDAGAVSRRQRFYGGKDAAAVAPAPAPKENAAAAPTSTSAAPNSSKAPSPAIAPAPSAKTTAGKAEPPGKQGKRAETAPNSAAAAAPKGPGIESAAPATAAPVAAPAPTSEAPASPPNGGTKPDQRMAGGGYQMPSSQLVSNVQAAFAIGRNGKEVEASAIAETDDGYVNFGKAWPDGRYFIDSKGFAIGLKDGTWGRITNAGIEPQGTYDPKNLEAETIRVLKEAGAKPREAPKPTAAPKAAPAPVPKPTPSADTLRAQADLQNALADLGDLLGRPFRANIAPEQEAKLVPILTRVLDAAFRLGYHRFKDAAKYALDRIREALGADVADAITLDHLQGAYIAMAGGKKGVSSKRDVIAIEDKAEIESHVAALSDTSGIETGRPSADTGENSNGPAADSQPGLGNRDSGRVRAPEGSGRPGEPVAPDAASHPGDVGTGQPATVGEPGAAAAAGAGRAGAAGEDVRAGEAAAGGRPAGDGRSGAGGARNPDAGAGERGSAAGAEPAGARGRADGEPAAAPSQDVEASPANPGPGDFVITDPLRIVGGGQVARFEKNKAAIELRNQLVDSGRKPTREEQEVLAGYTGWGSFGQELFQGTWERPAPKKGWEERDRWLRDNLGQRDWEGMQGSIINAHYTDPPTVLAMWDMVRRMGFTGGRVLEPSIGIGNFFGMMPAELASRSQRAGIELDPVTGSMAQMLYPEANIRIQGFEESKTPDNFYDLVIGNWPFFEHGPADRRYNRLNPTLHDYFFLKAIDQVKPGGLVVGITTKGTMDKKAIGARMEMARKAELLTAVRLPSGAFEEYAGTRVVTDIIVLRKRGKPVSVPTEKWIEVKDHPTAEGTAVPVNEYFHEHPDHVLGTIDFGHGTTTFRPGLIVHRPADMAERLKAIVQLVPEGAFQANQPAKRVAYLANHTNDRTNALTYTDQGLFVVRGDYLAPANDERRYALKTEGATKKREAELRGLVDMRRLYGRLIEAERAGKADEQRMALREAYEQHRAAYGPLADSFGLNYLEKIEDPFFPALAALESRVERDGKVEYRPAAILTQSTMRGRPRMESPTIGDAFVLARAEAVNPTMEQVAAIAGKPADEVKRALVESGAVFEMPNGDVQPADLYLSGNVREKLREAETAKEAGNAAMDRNVKALREVVPPDVPYYKIETQMGATWVPPRAYQEYIAHMLGLNDTSRIEVAFKNGGWHIQFPSEYGNRAEANSGFGSPNVRFKRLVRAAIANQTINVKRKDSDGNEYVDTEATKEANGKIADMRMKFGEWLWADPVRRAELEREYNEVRNAYATPKFDGSFLPFQGMALTLGRGPFNLREHQVNAIWRALVTRKSLNAHEVGTGKTFTMGGIAVESRRYGLAKKPMLFAHNANSKSVAHEIQQMYPAAKVLYVDNLSRENVKTRMMQIANDDWDAVVLPHSVIDRIGFKEETLREMAREEIRDLEVAAEEAAEEDNAKITPAMWDDEEELKKLRSPTAKQLVKQRLKILATIQKLAQQASREGAVSFEDLGVDMLLVDEAHEFKKPPIATKMKMKGLQTQTSNRSIAMMFLTRYVRAMNGGGNVHLFTGTPVTNTMTEVFHMMRYMMQEEMEQAALADWDGWFGSFAREVNDVELTPTGDYEAVTRLQAFINVPELRRMIGQYMDVVFADDMPEMKPRQVNGKTMASKDLTERERGQLLNGRTEGAQDRPYKKVVNESADMSPEQLHVFEQVRQWANRWRNMGKQSRREAMLRGAPESPIIHEGIAQKASFDVRLVDGIANAGKEGTPEMEPHPASKPARVVKNLLELYRSHPDANQVVFMEQGMGKTVSRSEGPIGAKRQVTHPSFSTLFDMVERLVQAGVPREQIAWVDGSTSKDRRKEIADAMNEGKVRIVFGSTDSLGVGVNMQRNLRAMHHMDAPWMPGELEQRNGRGHRQGNQWNTVLEYRYLTDRLDGRRWQVLAIKQRFITEFMKSKGEARVIEGDAAAEDGGSDILGTFSDAAGDPRVLLREKYKKQLEQLQSRERLHTLAKVDATRELSGQEQLARSLGKQLSDLRASGTIDKIGALLNAQRGDGFRAVVDGKEFAKRADAQEAISKWLNEHMRIGDERTVGTFGGIELSADWPKTFDQPMLTMKVGGFVATGQKGSLTSLEMALRHEWSTAEAELERKIDRAAERARHARAVVDEPFHMADKLRGVQKQLDDLEADIARNPVAPPFWLRAGAPVDTEVFRGGKSYAVTGHRWSPDGWFVLAQDSRGEVAIPYTEAQDAQGLNLYEPRDFQPPTVAGQNAAASAPPVASTPPPSASAKGASDPHGARGLGNDTDVAFSRAQAKRGTGDSVGRELRMGAIDRMVSHLTANWLRKPDIHVLESLDDAPEAVRSHFAQESQAEAAGIEGVHYRGNVYLFADMLATGDDVRRVLYHESLGHFGLRGVFGKDLDPILDQIATMRRSLVAAKAKQYGLDLSKIEERRMAAEEVLAEMAQTRPELGWVQRTIALIRRALRAVGVKLGLSDNDIIANYLLPARGFVERARDPNPSSMSGPAASRTRELRGAALKKALEERGQQVIDRLDAQLRWNKGETIYAFHENAPGPHRVRSVSELNSYAPDLLMSLPSDDDTPMASRKVITGDTGQRQYTPEQLRAMRNVGFEVEVPTVKERLQALWKDAGKKLAQGIADQFRPVKDLDENAYMLLRMSKGASGAFETLLHGGQLKLSAGVYDFNEQARGGVIEKLLVPLQGEHHDFMRWVAANRAERLLGEGKENLFTPQDIADLKTLATGQLAADYTIQNGPQAGQVTRDRAVAYRDSLATFNAFNKNVLDMAEASGLIDGASRRLWEHEFYVPFYRVADDQDGGIRGANIKTGVVRQQAFKALKGGKDKLNADLLDNTLMNWAHLLDAAAKNRAAKATLEAAERAGVAIGAPEETARQIGRATGNRNGVVWFADQGMKRHFVVEDPYLLTALTSLEYAGMRNPVMDAMGSFKHALTVGVTASPFFKVRNLIRDTLQVVGTSNIDGNVAKNLGQGWKATAKGSEDYFRLLAGGGTIHFGTMLEGSEAKRVQALVESGVDRATILDTPGAVKAFYRRYLEPAITAYNELGNRGEAINRAALYKQLLAQGLSHAEASLQARDLMDFSMQGSWTTVRFLTQVVPFFNARVQGLYKLGRAAKEDPRRFGIVVGATALASIGLLLAFGGDDDWKKREEWDRNNFWWFKFGDTAFRIPKPFEVGAIATLTERSWELAFDDEMTGKRFRNQVLQLLSDNLSLNPIPQLLKPMVDVYANTDSFTNRPIETMGMERLRSEYRFTDRTSMTARALSKGMNAATDLIGKEALSPVQIDHMLRGYFGWLGTFIVGATDTVFRPLTDQPTHPTPDYWKAWTGGMVAGLPEGQSRYVSQMYEQAKELERAYGTWRSLLKEGKVAEAAEFRADHGQDLGKYHHVETVKRGEAFLNQRIRVIERSDLDPDVKRQRIREVELQKDRLARTVAPTS